MVNQNPMPYLLREDMFLQAGETTDRFPINHALETSEEFHIFGVRALIMDGNYDLGNIDLNALNRHSFSFTDIDDPYLDNRDDIDLPICCDPRTWEDIDFYIYDTNDIPQGRYSGAPATIGQTVVQVSNAINLSVVNHLPNRQWIFATPIIITANTELAIELINNNPATATRYTYSWIRLELVGDLLNEEELLKHDMALSSVPAGKNPYEDAPTPLDEMF